jgi:phage tail-like protein
MGLIIHPFLGTFNRTTDEDPLKDFGFRIEIQGFTRMGFAKGSAPSVKVEQIKYREGGDNYAVKKSPGLPEFTDITLERGMIVQAGDGNDEDCWAWMTQVFNYASLAQKKTIRRSVDYVLLDRESKEVLRYRLHQAWVCELTPFSDLDAQGNNNMITKAVICYEGFTKVLAVGFG